MAEIQMSLHLNLKFCQMMKMLIRCQALISKVFRKRNKTKTKNITEESPKWLSLFKSKAKSFLN